MAFGFSVPTRQAAMLLKDGRLVPVTTITLNQEDVASSATCGSNTQFSMRKTFRLATPPAGTEYSKPVPELGSTGLKLRLEIVV